MNGIRFKRLFQTVCLVCMTVLFVTGCMYPKSKMPQNQVNVSDAVESVQEAVDEYYEKKQILPIVNREMETDNYDKYSVDFRRLTGSGILGQIPTIAFENGGSYKFVVTDPDGSPKVKLMDLAAIQTIGDLQMKINAYHDEKNAWPVSGEISAGFSIIDFDKLGSKAIQIRSPYSNMYLGLMLDQAGTVWIDYAPEIMIAMNKQEATSLQDVEDLRDLLIEQSVFMPVVSVPYTNKNNEPIPVQNTTYNSSTTK